LDCIAYACYGIQQVIEIAVTKDMLDKAKARADKVKLQPTAELTRYGSQYGRTKCGFIGEEVVACYLGIKLLDNFDFDFIYHGLRCDIKTRVCAVRPLPGYTVGVNNIRRQTADVYIFAVVAKDHSHGWIVGVKGTKRFYQEAVLIPTGGQMNPSTKSKNGPLWALKINQLSPIEKLTDYEKKLLQSL
jgi:hypothetical protein